jgi:plastocyanin
MEGSNPEEPILCFMDDARAKRDVSGDDLESGAAGGRIGFGWWSWTLEQVLVAGGLVSMVFAAVILVRGDLTVLGLEMALLSPGIVLTGLLLWKPKPRLFLAAGIANSALPIAAIPLGLLAALADPLAFPAYQGYVLATLSILLALPGGVSGYLRGRWHLPAPSLREGLRSLHGLATIAVVGLSVGAMVAGALAYDHIPVPAGPPEAIDFEPPQSRIVVTADSRFQPSGFNVTVAVVTEITVLNEDAVPHTFTYTVDGATYSHDVFGKGTTRFLVLFSGPGTVPFSSVAPGDTNMSGNITVVSG